MTQLETNTPHSAFRNPHSDPLRILLLEDVPTDAELVKRELTDAGIAFTSRWVDTRDAFLKELQDFSPDIVLSDYSLPQFDGMSALKLVQEKYPLTPVIVVTGTINEETAVDCIKRGAADYVLKGHLTRLGPAVKGAMEKRRIREEKERAEEELRTAVREWRTTFDAIGDAVCLLDPKGTILRCNTAMADLLGKSFQEIIGRTCWGLVHGTSEPIEGCPVQRMHKTRLRETLVLKTDGQYLKVTADPLLDEDKNLKGCVHIITDISDSKRMEQERIQMEKLSSLGTMAAGIAHELNNPMMGMLGFVEYCIKHTTKEDRRYIVLKDTIHEIKRCTDIVGNLLTFSRVEKGKEEYEKQSFTTIFDRVLRLLSYRITKENVSITQQIAEEASEIWMKTGNIQQVFLNLITNALDVLEESENKEIHVDVRPVGEFAQVTVSDTGCGIHPEHLQKIFDPFFTTKPAGQGTGLGLSVSQGIVKAHGGEITCESEVGKGTKFKVLLPIGRD